MHKSMVLAGILLVHFAGTVSAQDAEKEYANPLKDTLDTLGAVPCDLGDLTCITITSPRDHFANDPSATIDITYAISLATQPSKGMVIYVVGGPGGSGLAVADDYLTYFDPDFVAQMDFVFLDQRGTGPVNGYSCPEAQKVFDLAEPTLADPAGTKAIAQTYVTDCLAETKNADLAPFVETEQAIRDLEDFRLAIGSPKIWVYGESYGTQFSQQYATAFPQAVAGVVLDGVVDLHLTVSEFYGSYAGAAENILTRVLDGCADVPGCAADMQGDATLAFDALAAKLAKAPIPVDVRRADGSVLPVDLTLGALQLNTFNGLFGPDSRADFLRALAAANRGDLLPMLEQSYSGIGIDPATGTRIPDPTYDQAAYFAINCADYTEPGATADDRANAILADAQAFAPSAPRMLDVFWVERIVCAYWPKQGQPERPAQFAGGDYPTIILNGDADPITPIIQSHTIMDTVKNGFMVAMEGGPHVIWGRELACPDIIVRDLMIDGNMPAAVEQICAQDLIDGYAPLTLANPADADDALTVAQAMEVELDQSVALSNFDEDPLTVGCAKGGSVTISKGDNDATDYSFAACAWWPGVVVDGTGVLVDNGGAGDGMMLDLTVSGDHQGKIAYHNDTYAEAWVISGTYDGKAISVRE